MITLPNKAPIVICPFYISSKGLAVSCEGIEDGEVVVRKFKNTEQKKRWMRRYCKKFGYAKCPVAQLAQTKYNGGTP